MSCVIHNDIEIIAYLNLFETSLMFFSSHFIHSLAIVATKFSAAIQQWIFKRRICLVICRKCLYKQNNYFINQEDAIDMHC